MFSQPILSILVSLSLKFSHIFVSFLLFYAHTPPPLSPQSFCSLREPAGKLALGYKQEAYNHMLDIFMKGVCGCVCVKEAREGV